MEKSIRVRTPDGSSYEAVITDSFGQLSMKMKQAHLEPDRIGIISDSNTKPLFEDKVRGALQENFPDIRTYTFPAGEENKNLETITGIYDFLLSGGFTRKSVLLSLGGGVVGDMTGFAAATYRRGIPFVQIPTTLLSQVDASIGGKTGFDYHRYKNMIGAFHMPSLVYISTSALDSLPEREYAGGLAENIKHGLIRSEDFYGWMLENMDGIVERSRETVSEMIQRSLKIKQSVVESDPTEKGERMILNFGHTIGHAVEKAKNFSLIHGECVALGCLAAAKISCSRGYISEEELFEFRDSCVGFGLPILLDGTDTDRILEYTKSDKKAADGHVRFILLKKIGKAFIADDVTEQEMRQGIDFINGDLTK
jgi:3-dehydroquinate synthase